MWFAALMTLINSILHQHKVQNVYRVSIGVMQIGILEVLIGVGILLAMVRGGSIRGRFPVIRTHPVLPWILGLMGAGIFFGVLGGIINRNDPKTILTALREYATLPICILIAHRLVGTPRNVRAMTIITLLAGVLTATMLFVSFGEKSEAASLGGGLNPIRSIIINWHSEYAVITALTLVFVVLTRFPLWPTWVSILLGVYCYIGYAATLSRLGFLILFFGTAASYLLLAKGERLRRFLRSVAFIPLLFFACWGALWLGDQIIGRNFSGKVMKHIESTLPGERGAGYGKAWDTRIGGIIVETRMWMQNPLMGQGFGAGSTAFITGKEAGSVAFNHNSWTATLAESGMLGFAGLAVIIGSMMLIGYRMVHDRTDAISVLAGALGFFTGFVFFLRASGTMGITPRSSVGFGLVAGLLIRAREIQETEVAMARQAAYYDQYIDQQTGLLVPEYSWEMGHFSTN